MPGRTRPGRSGTVASATVLCKTHKNRTAYLTYLAPEGARLRAGDVVACQVNETPTLGVVTGPGEDLPRAKTVDRVLGRLVGEAEIRLAETLAAEYLTDPHRVFPRLADWEHVHRAAAEAGQPGLKAEPLEAPGPPLSLMSLPPAADHALTAARIAGGWATGGGQALVLCPTRKHAGRVLQHFDAGAAVLGGVDEHGASSWKGFAEGRVAVGVGTRAAALWHAPRLAGIVVVDDAHPGHREASHPTWTAVEVAARRGRLRGVPVVVLTGVPDPRTLGLDGAKLIEPDRSRGWPEVRVVDPDRFDPRDRLKPPPVSKDLKDGQAIVVTPAARAPRRCPRCRSAAAERSCGRCGGPTVPGPEAAAWDGHRLVDPADLLGLGAGEARTAVLCDFDRILSEADPCPPERACRVLWAAMRAAGDGGKVWVVTSKPRHPAVLSLAVGRRVRPVAVAMWNAARRGRLPPWTRQITVTSPRPIADAPDGTRVHGPRRTADGRFETVVLSPKPAPEAVADWVRAVKRRKGVRVSIA